MCVCEGSRGERGGGGEELIVSGVESMNSQHCESCNDKVVRHLSNLEERNLKAVPTALIASADHCTWHAATVCRMLCPLFPLLSSDV